MAGEQERMDTLEDGSSSRTTREGVERLGHGRGQAEAHAHADLLVSTVADVIVFSAPTLALSSRLSQSERSVAALLIAGHSNAEIAQARATSAKTVANQLYAMYRKFGVQTREELVAALVEDQTREPINADDRPQS